MIGLGHSIKKRVNTRVAYKGMGSKKALLNLARKVTTFLVRY